MKIKSELFEFLKKDTKAIKSRAIAYNSELEAIYKPLYSIEFIPFYAMVSNGDEFIDDYLDRICPDEVKKKSCFDVIIQPNFYYD